MPKSIYLHIPFCKTHCPYCDFAVWINKRDYFEKYTEALCSEIKTRSKKEQIQTIYFGGGTPSILPINNIKQIMEVLKDSFQVSPDAEITFEVNPGTIDQNKLNELRHLGINRLSIGVQTFSEKLIKKLARGHSVQDAKDAVVWSVEAGFQNISLDLIYGLPQQSEQDWLDSINEALSLPIQHISCYSLTIEEGTPFKKMFDNAKHPSLPQEEALVNMYETLQTQLKRNNFVQYEVSNFAKTGFESKHNLTYWRNEGFYGFGVSAHEFTNGERKAHSRDLEKYIQNPLEQEVFDCNPQLEELMLGLRTKEGVNLEKYFGKYNINLLTEKEKIITKLQSEGLLQLTDSVINLTQKGFLLSTEIIGSLL
jgi:oxygen-independent coproporphyrinogen-3 oxidase